MFWIFPNESKFYEVEKYEKRANFLLDSLFFLRFEVT